MGTEASTDEMRLGELALPAHVVSATLSERELEALFLAQPDLERVVVEHGRMRGLLTRERFLAERVSRRSAWARMRDRRSVAGVSALWAALELPASTSVAEAGRLAFARDEPRCLDDVLVSGLEAGVGVVPFARLLSELTRVHIENAKHDPLTGLANRTLLFERLEMALTDEPGAARACLLFIDVDDFKSVNDSLGHLAGDELLVAVADRLRGAFRDCDLIARIGGDEFVVLLSVADADGGRAAADRVLLSLSAPLSAAGREFSLLASVGVAVRTDETAPDQMLRAADLAMYDAKRSGKGRVGVYRPALHATAVERLELRRDLPVAIAEGAIDLAFQPIVDLETGAMHGVEALARWEHPERGPIRPLDFVRLAEETGAIGGLGELVLRTALQSLHAWTPALPSLRVGVNVSMLELEEPGYPQRVAHLLESAGVEPRRLILEITETMLSHDDGVLQRTLGELRELGVGLAIDDFGTGFSSLARLGELPIGVIKLDKRFVDRLALNAERRLLQGLVRLAGEMSIDVVAEGIEERPQLEMLRSMHCRLGQGYLISRPMPADAVLGWAEGRGTPIRS